MTLHNASARRRPGFTLIELLTVVAIISLLIGILLPSLARARDQARATKIRAMLSSIDKALEMFHNDFGQYPDSSKPDDPINWTGSGLPPEAKDLRTALVTSSPRMSGAHWLARALVGHDYKGVDSPGIVMGISTPSAITDYDYPVLAVAQRRPLYFEGKVFVRDDDTSSGLSVITSAGISDFVATGRMIVIDDAFKSPILYYRANERAANPFTKPGASGDEAMPGVYRHADNALITGTVDAAPLGWDFASTGRRHQIAPYSFNESNPTPVTGANPVDNVPTTGNFTNTFVRYLHNESACKSTMTIRPMNPDTFILISAGKDGTYGTDDDINNFSTSR